MRTFLMATALMAASVPLAQADCAGSGKTDACLVGDWLMTDGGPMAWMKEQMSQAGGEFEITEFTQKPVDADGAMHFKADGTFQVDPIRTRMAGSMSQGGMTMSMENQSVASSSGRWSVSGTTLNLCTEVQNMEGSTKISMPGMTQEIPTRNPPKQDMAFVYSCQGKTLETRVQVKDAGEIVSTFKKQ